MGIVTTVLVLLALWLLGALVIPGVRTDEWDKKTLMTFSEL